MVSQNKSTNESTIACDLHAIEVDQRDQHGLRVRALFSTVQEAKELPGGYAFRLPTDSTSLTNAAEFIANERLCCPFIEFSINVTANGGPIWLQLAGTEVVKEFIKTEIVGNLVSTVDPTVAIQKQC